MRRVRLLATALVAVLALASCTGRDKPVRIGAIYPLSGPQAVGGIEEFRGVKVAADLVNADGGVDGRRIELNQVDVPEADAAPGAVRGLADQGVELFVGSYGSTISSPAAQAAVGRGRLFWETGAVGKMAGTGAGDLVFRVAPTGGVLGRSAISFVADQLAAKLHRAPGSLRSALTPASSGSSTAGHCAPYCACRCSASCASSRRPSARSDSASA